MKKITIKNFRCYEYMSMEFRNGINLLIGDNSVGKTSLLRACNYVISSFFCGYSLKYTKWTSPSPRDFRYLENENGSKVIAKQISIIFNASESDFPNIALADGSCRSLDLTKSQTIEKKSAKNAKPLKSKLNVLREYGALLAKNTFIEDGKTVRQINALPVYAFFSTDDIHGGSRKIDKSGFKEESQLPSFGYYECHNSKGLLDCWFQRMLILEEDGKYPIENTNVRMAIQEALGENGCNIIKDLEFRVNKRQILFHLVDGRKVYYDYLSDGYQRLANIVIDISIRCALLNKSIYGNEAYKKTHGTVIIDEIDEHLHPALQVRILKALSSTFENVQFIVSTHSPLVISSVENNSRNVVYKLEYDKDSERYAHRELITYGMDANVILAEGMGASVRELSVDAMIRKVETSISDKNLQQAKDFLDQLERITTPTQPELVRLRAIIKRLELIGR